MSRAEDSRATQALPFSEAVGQIQPERLAAAVVRAVHRQADALNEPPVPSSACKVDSRPLSRRILVRRDTGLGDILFALTAAEALHKAQPSLGIDFATSECHAEWIRWFPFIRRVLTELPDVADYEAVFDHEQFLDKNFPGERAVGMGVRGGVAPRTLVSSPGVPSTWRRRARERVGLGGGRRTAGGREPVIGFAPLAANGTLTRSLPVGMAPEFVAALRAVGTVVLLHEERVGMRLRRGVVNLTGKLSLAEAIAVVGECDAFVGVDSGLLHVAAMFRKPVVGLFSHIEATRRLTLAERLVALQPAMGCFPCGDIWRLVPGGVAPPCRPGFRNDQDQPPLDCLQVFTPELVAEALQHLVAAPAEGVDTFAAAGGMFSNDGASPRLRRARLRLDGPLDDPRAGARGYEEARTVLAVADGRVVSEWTPPLPVPLWVRDEKTAIVILNHCTWQECTKACLEAVLEHTALPFQVVLLDNGSTTAEYEQMAATIPKLERKHRCKGAVKLLRADRNLGFPGGVNRALAEVDSRVRYVSLLNSDCFIREPRWNQRAAQLFREDWRLAALCLTKGEHRYFLDGDTGRDYYFPQVDGTLGDCELVNGSCLLIDRQKAGDFRLDERFSPGSREDDDLCFQLRAAGWSVGQAPDFEIVHEHSTTLRKKKWSIRWNGKSYDYHKLLQRNRGKLLRKWPDMLHPRTDARGSLAHVARSYRPKVTVIIPTCDRLEIIDESVQSVLAQTLGDFELIIVAATKREVAALSRRYADEPRVKVVRQEGRGIAAARNTGMKAGRGVCFAHLDDDEVWAPEHLAALVGYLDRYPHVGMVYGDVRRCRGYFRKGQGPQVGQPTPRGGRRKVKGRQAGRLAPRRAFVELEDLGTPWCRQFDYGQLVHGNWIPASAVVMRREVFEALGRFDESVRYADDWEYWLRIGRAFPVAHCCTISSTGKPTVTYRLHGKNATQRDPEVWAANLALVRERYARSD